MNQLPSPIAAGDYQIDPSGVSLADGAKLRSPIVGAARLVQPTGGPVAGMLHGGVGVLMQGFRAEMAPRSPNLQGAPINGVTDLTCIDMDVSGIWDNFYNLKGNSLVSTSHLKTCYDSFRNGHGAVITVNDTIFTHGVPAQGYIRYCYADYDGHYIFNRCVFVCTLAPTDLTTKINALIANSDPLIDPTSSGPSIIELNDCIIAATQGITQLRQNGSGRIIVRRTQYNKLAYMGNVEQGI